MNLDTRWTLLERLRDPADQEAWREFNLKYRELILRYCRRRGLQEPDADDICQWVMLGLARAASGFRYDPRRGRFRSYLGRAVGHAIARHVLPRESRGQALDPSFLEDLSTAGTEGTDATWEQEWMMHHYRLAMRTVRANFDAKSVGVFESLRDGESVASVALTCGLSMQAVHKIKQRVRNRLMELIDAQVRDEDGSGV